MKALGAAGVTTPFSLLLQDVKHGHDIAKTAGHMIRSVLLAMTWRYSLLHLDVTKCQRDEQHLKLLRLGRQRQEKREDIIDTLVVGSVWVLNGARGFIPDRYQE